MRLAHSAFVATLLVASVRPAALASPAPIASSINQLGLDLLRSSPGGESGTGNRLLSPYSIETALGLAFVGAEGKTREEMRRVLHLPADDSAALAGFAALQVELDAMLAKSQRDADWMKQRGGKLDVIELNVANRVYSQSGYGLLPGFLAATRDTFRSEARELDFRAATEASRTSINDWVAEQTHDRIKDLIPAGGVGHDTRAVLVNALYLRAPWENPFIARITKPAPFWVDGTQSQDVPTMSQKTGCGYAEFPDHVAVSLPYRGGDLHFLILLPREHTGLTSVLKNLTDENLQAAAHLPNREVILNLPKLKLAGRTVALGDALAKLGMPTAFDRPAGSADFSRLAPRQADNHPFFSEVFHQTFLELDERGTEAAAATAVALRAGSALQPKPAPKEVHVDHPFLFAIQHAASGACLFLGWVNDPRPQ